MASQSTSEQADNPPDYDSIPPRGAIIECIRTPAAPELPGIQSQRNDLCSSSGSVYTSRDC
ncbi:unnamed protein product [Penicillium glandicola]